MSGGWSSVFFIFAYTKYDVYWFFFFLMIFIYSFIFPVYLAFVVVIVVICFKKWNKYYEKKNLWNTT